MQKHEVTSPHHFKCDVLLGFVCSSLVSEACRSVVHRMQQMPRQSLVTDEQKMSVKLNRQSPTTLPCDRMMAHMCNHY